MDPIPPSSFYGLLADAVIDPVLLKDTANQSRPSSTPTSAHPSTPPSSNELPLVPKARKTREEFTMRDLDHLLATVLAVNPYMAPRMKIGEKWREIATLVQEKGFCQNREVDTLKNKVSSMLTWVEGGKKHSARSPLGRVLEQDPVTFAGLCGKLDAVQHLKIQARDTLEELKEHTKEAQNVSRTSGESMRMNMMKGHAKAKRTRSSRADDSGKENQVDEDNEPGVSSTESNKRTRLTSVSRVHGARETARVARILEKSEEREEQREKAMETFHASLLERQDRALAIQERTATALLDIIREGLLK
ncbi:hypothetical protein JB92DRAFT_3146622 [Gautieria morchelliformis]|nr:hypothetical protein JB92DRAFT_3146622 [Gautieria morchelliformis]